MALKGLGYQSLPVNLLQGEQRGAGLCRGQPGRGRVPALRTDGGELLVQSPAIIEYLEEVYPQPALLPATAEARAKVRGVAAIIGCGYPPGCTTSACSTGCARPARTKGQVNQWIGHWISQGLAAVEQLIGDHGFCFGDEPGLAGCLSDPAVVRGRTLQHRPRQLPAHPAGCRPGGGATRRLPRPTQRSSRTARLSEWNGSPPEACRYVRKASGAGPGPLSAITHAPDRSARPAGNPDAGIAKRE
ncbi:maleylacetoacetate isomerase [Pseudomonas putida S11]|nr:maleylacetoacetate isomerase [Pseudomonas putida S11]